MTRRSIAVLSACAVAMAMAGCTSSPGVSDPDEHVELTFAFWGNDLRADLYDEAIAAFEEQNPNIDVTQLFLGPNEYWEKRQTEAAGGGLPDVFTMDMAYLRQYAENGLLADLSAHLGKEISVDEIDEGVREIGVVNGTPVALPLTTNASGLFLNLTLLARIGVAPFGGGTWADYNTWVAEVSAAAAAAGTDAWGAADTSWRLQNFELQLRSDGGELFTEEGEPGFTKEDLREFWESTSPIRASQGFLPQQKLEEAYPLTGFDAGLVASEITWDNFGAGYLANLGEDVEIEIVAPPTGPGADEDLYLKASQLYSIAASSDHQAAGALLIDFLVNSPESGAIFGTNRGVPASRTALEAAQLDAVSTMVADYESSISERLGDAPPLPISGFGTLEVEFRELSAGLGFGTTTVDEAVDQFFAEMDVVLNQ